MTCTWKTRDSEGAWVEKVLVSTPKHAWDCPKFDRKDEVVKRKISRKEYVVKYRETHREETRKKAAEYRIANREYIRAYGRLRNKALRKATDDKSVNLKLGRKEYRERNKDRINARRREVNQLRKQSENTIRSQ